MKIFYELDYNHNLSLALGYFDGVHLGHQCVIKNAVQVAQENKIQSGVITFRNSPKDFFTKNKTKNIVSLNDRINLIEQLGIDYVYLLNFNENLAYLTAEEYLRDKLVKYFSPKAITTGFNHTFGSDRASSDFLKKNQEKYAYKYFEIPPITYNHELISSSVIKGIIETGDFQKAKNLLGYEFYIEGTIIEGNKLGRTISFPTANVIYPENIITIETGIYIAKVVINNKTLNAILNYGKKPTVSKQEENLLEAHIFNFNEDIYGKELKIIPLQKIRNEQKFCSLNALKTQIEQDVIQAEKYFVN